MKQIEKMAENALIETLADAIDGRSTVTKQIKRMRDKNLSYAKISQSLNDQDTPTAWGNKWTKEKVRKFYHRHRPREGVSSPEVVKTQRPSVRLDLATCISLTALFMSALLFIRSL